MAVMQEVLLFGSETWVFTPPVGEIPREVSPPCGTAGGGHGPQTSAGREVSVHTHWGGAGNGGTGGDWGIYCPPPEHGRTIHCYSYYHGLVFGGGAEDGNAPIQAMVGSAHPGYHGDKGRAVRHRGWGGGEGGRTRGIGRGRLGQGRMAGRE